jgi:hypothetical protein
MSSGNTTTIITDGESTTIITGDQGPPGPQGTQGIQGIQGPQGLGSAITLVSAPPSSGSGRDADYAIDQNVAAYYKQAGAWTPLPWGNQRVTVGSELPKITDKFNQVDPKNTIQPFHLTPGVSMMLSIYHAGLQEYGRIPLTAIRLRYFDDFVSYTSAIVNGQTAIRPDPRKTYHRNGTQTTIRIVLDNLDHLKEYVFIAGQNSPIILTTAIFAFIEGVTGLNQEYLLQPPDSIRLMFVTGQGSLDALGGTFFKSGSTSAVYTGAYWTPSKIIGTLGQSQVERFLLGAAPWQFGERLAVTSAAQVPNGVRFFDMSTPNTYASKANYLIGGGDIEPGAVAHFWVNDDALIISNPNTFDPFDDSHFTSLAHGDILTNYLDLIALKAPETLPDSLFTDLGYSEAGPVSGLLGIGQAEARARYILCLRYLVREIKAAILTRKGSSADPSTIKVGVMLVGRHLNNALYTGQEVVRQAQLKMIDLLAGQGWYKFVELWDVTLDGNAHIDIGDGGMVAGPRAADRYAANVLGVTGLPVGPAVGTITKVSSTTVTIQIVADSGLNATLYPSGDRVLFPLVSGPAVGTSGPLLTPACWRIEDSAVPGTAIGFTASVNSSGLVTMALATPLTGQPVFFAPYDLCQDFYPDGVIKGSVSGKPLQSYYRG